jgi:hypothetical protein
MNREPVEQTPDGPLAYGVIGAVLVLMFLFALAVSLEAEKRPLLERMIAPTAVGDPVSLKVDPRDNPGREVLNWNNQAYFLQTNQPANVPEFDAYKVGRDDAGQVQLYQVKKQNDLRIVLVKIGRNEFLRLTPR